MSDYADELYDDELYDEAPTFDAETFAAMEDAAEAARVAYDEAFDEALAESEARWADEDAAREAQEQEAASLEAAEQNAAMLIVNGCEQAGIVDDAARAEVYRLAEGLVRDPDFHHDPRGRAEAAIGKAVELVSTPKDEVQAPSRFVSRRNALDRYIDAAPLLPVGDAIALSAYVDAIVLVVRLNALRSSALDDVRRILASSPAVKLGFVLTGVEIGEGYLRSYLYGPPKRRLSGAPVARRSSRASIRADVCGTVSCTRPSGW